MTKMREWGLQDKPLNTASFECSSHASCVLAGMESLRAKGQLLDITLLAEGQSFQAHRAVLAASSDYFRAMFTDAMLESRQKEIRLNGVSAEGMRLLLDYAYTAKLALTLANIQDVLSAASHLQMDAVVEACSSYLQSQLDIDNCVDIATISETYSLAKLKRRVYRFMSCHLLEFASSPEFHRLGPQQLEYLLACDFPVDCSEADVLRIVLSWFMHPFDSSGKSHRLGHALLVLCRVHFTEISEWAIEHILTKSMVKRNDSLYQLVLAEVFRQIHMASAKLATKSLANPLVNSRGMELAVVKVGGFGIAGITNEITYCLSSKRKWRHLTSIPHVEQCNYGTVVLDNELFVVGGCFNQSLQENIHPFGFRYNPKYNKWSTMAPMQIERCRFSLNVVGGRLYAVGGASESEDFFEELSLCECYDPVADTWRSISPLPEYRTQHAGASMPRGRDNHWLFISGGLDKDFVLSSMRRYDSLTDSWEACAPMLTPRADHVMLCLGQKLFVCGGWFEDGDTGNRVLVETIDAYDPAANSWEVVTHVPTPRYHAGIVGVDNKIYFIGGFHSDAMFDRDTAAIECYNVDSDSWTTGDKYPQDVWEHTCVTLYIPTCREDMEVMALDSGSSL